MAWMGRVLLYSDTLSWPIGTGDDITTHGDKDSKL